MINFLSHKITNLFAYVMLGIFFLSLFVFPVSAQNKVEIDFFFSPTCPHCAKEKIFLNEMEDKYPELIVNRFDIVDQDSFNFLLTKYDEYGVPQDDWGSVPVTYIDGGEVGNNYFIGYSESVDESFEKYIVSLMGGVGDVTEPEIKVDNFERFSGFSPFLLSAVMGGLDGFNACAMVALGFLLAILIGTGVRKRVIIIGGTFILVSGAVYFLFISAWLNLFLFLGYLKIISIIVGVIILFFSLFLLKDYISGVVCKICDVPDNGKEGILTRTERKLFAFMSKMVSIDMSLPLLLLGVAAVAAGINMIELFCSFGFPLAYTKILTGHGLPGWQYYMYLLVYVSFYMLDDFLIFLAAVITLRVTKVGDKYLRAVKLISGIVMLILGLIMLFKPELLSSL